jgi:hypothetical protein
MSQCLSPVYGWFAEGFDTADLKERRRAAPATVLLLEEPTSVGRHHHQKSGANVRLRVAPTKRGGNTK